jgi:single-stranded DNA-specific DHH superfamily exonuclease
LTVKIEKLELLCEKMQEYCSDKILEENLEKLTVIDTQIFPHERTSENFALIEKFSPFGEGNPEPRFLFENLAVNRVEKVGKT